MEPIVRVCTRTRRVIDLPAGFTAWFLGLSAATGLFALAPPVYAQGEADAAAADDASEETPAVQVPAVKLEIDESQFDPPLSTQDQIKAWERANGETKFKQALKQDPPGAADREALTSGVTHLLYKMTVKEERGNLHLIVQEIIQVLNSPRLTSAKAREFANAEIVRVARELLGQPRAVRLNALILAASLVDDPSAEPPTPYSEAAPLFAEVLADPNQLIDSKIWAVKGLARICQATNASISNRNLAAVQLVSALDAADAKKPANWLYRYRIVQALGDTGILYNLQRQPIVIDALVGVLSDRKEHYMIRSEASRSVTRIPWGQGDSVNAPLIAYQICQLTRDMAEARNSNLKAPYWRYCFVNIYLSFKPYTSAERDQKVALLEQVTRPHLASSRAAVEAAYEAIIPVINSVTSQLNPRATPADEIKALDEWLDNHVPDDRKPTPSSPQVIQTQQRNQPMVDNTRQ